MNFAETVEMLSDLPARLSVLIMGDHGRGKTDAVRMAAKSREMPYVDLRLGQCDVGDIKGMPFATGGRTVWMMPEWFPISEQDALAIQQDLGLSEPPKNRYGDRGYLFLDEGNRGPRDVQQAAFELVQDYRLNMRYLPIGWRVVMAINDDDNLYHVTELDPAFLSRFFVIEFRPTREEWQEWGGRSSKDLNGIVRPHLHPAISEFCIRFPDFVDPTKDTIEKNPNKKLFDRRSWEKFTNTLYHFETLKAQGKSERDLLAKDNKSLSFLNLVASGFVGTLAAPQFVNFIKTDYQSLSADKILNDWDTDVEKRLAAIVKKKGSLEIAHYNELIIAFVRDSGKTDKMPETWQLNLIKYIHVLPNEAVADFWKKFNADVPVASLEWYQGKHKGEVAGRIVRCLANPATMKKAK